LIVAPARGQGHSFIRKSMAVDESGCKGGRDLLWSLFQRILQSVGHHEGDRPIRLQVDQQLGRYAPALSRCSRPMAPAGSAGGATRTWSRARRTSGGIANSALVIRRSISSRSFIGGSLTVYSHPNPSPSLSKPNGSGDRTLIGPVT
jgi:hypothetical protein